jgi:hypothetical protein
VPTHGIIRLHSRFSPEACREGLRLATDHDEVANWPRFKACRPLLCRIRGERIRLRCRQHGRNSFAPLFHGRLLAATGGTVIEGRFRMHLLIRMFMTFWFGCLGGGLSLATVLAVIRYKSLAAAVGTMLGPLLVLAFGYGIVRFGQWSARDQEREMVSLLKATLDAAEGCPPAESEPDVPGGRVNG